MRPRWLNQIGARLYLDGGKAERETEERARRRRQTAGRWMHGLFYIKQIGWQRTPRAHRAGNISDISLIKISNSLEAVLANCHQRTRVTILNKEDDFKQTKLNLGSYSGEVVSAGLFSMSCMSSMCNVSVEILLSSLATSGRNFHVMWKTTRWPRQMPWVIVT